MPTPFYHLGLAEDLLHHPALSGWVRDLLLEFGPAFLFGNTAPDVQTVSGQERRATHFFDLPIFPGMQPAWEQMLRAYPALAHSFHAPGEQAAFLAGYLCHLQADWHWVVQIFAPIFGPWAGWGRLKHRLYLHNVLRSYVDRQTLTTLSKETGRALETVSPQGWLPFVLDTDLAAWRDLLADQLHPGAPVKTVEVFAARQGIDPADYYQLLDSEDNMERAVFTRLPRQTLIRYREQVVDESAQFISACFGIKTSCLNSKKWPISQYRSTL